MLAHTASIARVDDGELVEQVRAGDTAAFGELVERHRGAVFRAALAALGNDAEAEDIAQEALVLAYRRIDQFRGDASVRTWMVSIAWRLSLSRRRQRVGVGSRAKPRMERMDERELDRAIETAASAIMARVPGRALTRTVMARVRQGVKPSSYRLVWVTRRRAWSCAPNDRGATNRPRE